MSLRSAAACVVPCCALGGSGHVTGGGQLEQCLQKARRSLNIQSLVAFLCSTAEESNPKDGVAAIGDVLKVFGTGWLTGPKGIRISDHKSICQ